MKKLQKNEVPVEASISVHSSVTDLEKSRPSECFSFSGKLKISLALFPLVFALVTRVEKASHSDLDLHL